MHYWIAQKIKKDWESPPSDIKIAYNLELVYESTAVNIMSRAAVWFNSGAIKGYQLLSDVFADV